jgi:Tfp pilus assembly protein PilF
MALILEPDDEDIQFYYGTTLIKLQDWTAAQAVFTRLVEQDPKNVFYRRNLALAYMFANDPESALYHLEESLQLAPDDQHTRGILDVLYGLTRQDDHATMEMKGALRLEPNEDTSKVQYGKLLNHLLEKLSEATAPL